MNNKARKMGWLRSVAALAVLMGVFVAAPVTAFADSGQNHGNTKGEANNGTDNGNGNDGSNSGSHTSVPEVPYAAALPIVIVGMTIFVYQKRKRAKSA